MVLGFLALFALLNDAVRLHRHSTRLRAFGSPKRPQEMQRQTLLTQATLLGSIALPQSAHAAARAKGAFEMDLDFYLRDLTLGKANIKPKVPSERARIPKGRTLNAVFAKQIIHIVEHAIAQVANKTVQEVSLQAELERKIQLPYFRTFVEIDHEVISDERYFDVTAYAYFKAAQKLIPTSEQRVALRSIIGQAVLRELEGDARLGDLLQIDTSSTSTSSTSTSSASRNSSSRIANAMPSVAKGLRRLLEQFERMG